MGLIYKNQQDYLSNLGVQISNAIGSKTKIFSKIENNIYTLKLPVGFSLFIPTEVFSSQPLIGEFLKLNSIFVPDSDESPLKYLIELLPFDQLQTSISNKDINLYFENNVENITIDCSTLQNTKLESDYHFYKITNVNDFEEKGITLNVKYNNNFEKETDFSRAIENLPTSPSEIIKTKKENKIENKRNSIKLDFMYSFFCKTRPYFYTIKNVLHPLQSHISYTNFNKNEHFIQNLCLFTSNYFEQSSFFQNWCFDKGEVYLKPGDNMTIQAVLKRKSNLFNYIEFYIDVEEKFGFLFQTPNTPVIIQDKRIQIPLQSSNNYNDELFYREIFFYNFNADHTNPMLAKPPFFIRINGLARENVFLSNGRALRCLAILSLSENKEKSTLEIEDSFDHIFNESHSLNFDLVDSNCNPIPFSSNSFLMLKISQS